MSKEDLNKEELVQNEVEGLRKRVRELEALENELNRVKNALQISEKRYKNLFDNAILGLYRTTPTGEILLGNTALIRMMGFSSFEEMNERNLEIDGFDLDCPREEFIRRITKEGAILGKEAQWIRKDGSIVSVRENSRAIRDEAGNILYFEGTVEDISDRKEAEKRINLLLSVIEQTREGIVLFDMEGYVIFINKAFADLHGYQPDDLFAQHFSMFHNTAQLESMESAMEQVKCNGEFKGEIWHLKSDGEVFPTLMHNSILEDDLGEPIGIIGMVKDITDLKKAQQEIQRINRALKSMSECGKAVVHEKSEWNLLAEICRIIVDVGGYKMAWIGYADSSEKKAVIPMAKAGDTQYLNNLHLSWTDDEKGRGPVGTAIHTGQTIIARDIQKDPGCAFWREEAAAAGFSSCIALPLQYEKKVYGSLNIYAADPDAFDAEEVKLLTELADDLTYGFLSIRAQAERRQAIEALREERDKAQRYLDIAGTLIVSLDTKGEIILINKTGCDVLGLPESEILGKNWFDDFLPAQNRDMVIKGYNKLLCGDLPLNESYENPLIAGTKEERYFAWRTTILQDERGEIIGTLNSGLDITDRRRAEEELRRLATIDTLTDVYNRRYGLVLLSQNLKLSKRNLTEMTICYIDVDDFKEINDTYGHQEGDKVLRLISTIFKQQLRDSDIICRIGGDEFLLIFPDCNIEEGQKLWDRIDLELDRLNASGKYPYKLDISRGFAQYDPLAPKSSDHLLFVADKEMYKDKHA